MTLSETEIIQRFFSSHQPTNSGRADVTIGIGDDAAAVSVPAGMELLSAIDTIVEGVHFPAHFDAADIGYRALAVNVSDIAAMGGQPVWALLSLSLPTVEQDWLAAFCDGFFELADRYDIALIGGDLVKGPLAATVSIMGLCPAGMAITRGGATPGDVLYVTGSPGAAALGLASLVNPDQSNPQCEPFFRRPEPRVAEGIALRGVASSMIDVSDGLLKDAGHIALSSNVEISLDAAAIDRVASGGLSSALSGGDDYELCFTVPPQRRDELAAATEKWARKPHPIGRVNTGCGLVMPGHDLTAFAGYDHFLR